MRLRSFLPALLFLTPLAATGAPVIVHEWGTFTSLQDEKGQAIPGINVDDEPAPPFVYAYWEDVLTRSNGLFGLPPYSRRQSEGYVTGDPEVTLRMETPILYFYPPAGIAPTELSPLTVNVEFHGGVMSQYYPFGRTKVLGKASETRQLNENTVSSLTWKVHLTTTGTPVPTDYPVWTAPRQVSASLLRVKDLSGSGGKDQTERFLFYRGVAHLDAPLQVTTDTSGDQPNYAIRPTKTQPGFTFGNSWFVEIKPDGTCAFRQLNLASNDVETAAFVDSDFSPLNLDLLKTSMHQGLVEGGLRNDEASAMLNTWQLSYFKSPGLRLFYLVPSDWTNHVLPLKISGEETVITRVMVGRIELINNAEHAALARLKAGPCPNLPSLIQSALVQLKQLHLQKPEEDAFLRGEKPITDLGVTIPPLLQDYLSLGRFRDALIVHEQAESPSPALAQFISQNLPNGD